MSGAISETAPPVERAHNLLTGATAHTESLQLSRETTSKQTPSHRVGYTAGQLCLLTGLAGEVQH